MSEDQIGICEHCDEEDELVTLICGENVCHACHDYSGAELKEKALPCPFCSGEADLKLAFSDDPTSEYASCADPDCCGSQIKTAVDIWNTRTAQPLEGWKLVPLQATKEMTGAAVNAAIKAIFEGRFDDQNCQWDAMLEAAPEPPHTIKPATN